VRIQNVGHARREGVGSGERTHKGVAFWPRQRAVRNGKAEPSARFADSFVSHILQRKVSQEILAEIVLAD